MAKRSKWERVQMFLRGFRDGAGGGFIRYEEDADYMVGYDEACSAKKGALCKFNAENDIPLDVLKPLREEPTP